MAAANDIVRDPTDLPGPVHARGPKVVHAELEAVELVGQLDNNTTYDYWTFNGKVPGPFLRVRVGDTVEVHLKVISDESMMSHSVDFHAVTPVPGGGAVNAPRPRLARKRRHLQDPGPGRSSTTAPHPWWRTTFRTACTA